MEIELRILLYAVLLAAAQLAVFAVFGNRDLGVRYTGGPRDKAPEGMKPVTARLQRAFDNHMETLPWFAVVVIVAVVSERTDGVTAAASWIYLLARIAYVPAYASGIRYVRSAIWGVATLAILVILFRLLL